VRKSAFPHGSLEVDNGMTLRDYFVAQAMVGLLGAGRTFKKGVVEDAYEFADAMLKEREAS
jgi:hypothetical protein